MSMNGHATLRIWFVAAVALVSAAVGDPCVELLANTGVFGAGYRDTNQLGVIPALIAASIFVAGLLVFRGLELWHRRADHDLAFGLPGQSGNAGSRLAELARIAPLQLAVIYGMECLEALAVHRIPPSGVAWLGAPPLFSLAAQLLVAAGCQWLMRGVIRWLLDGVVEVVRVAAAIVLRLVAAPPKWPASALGRRSSRTLRTQVPRGRLIGGRAPPALLLAPTH